MQIVVIAHERQKEELLSNGAPAAEVYWIENVTELDQYRHADACIDLLFENTDTRLQILRSLLPMPVLVNAVEKLDDGAAMQLTRFAGWPTFLKGGIVEASAPDEFRRAAQDVFACFHRSVEWVADEDGLVTPRVISMIIGEAYRALEEGVSSKEDIDTAMKLGTNYPYGPFEWAEKIGIDAVRSLLNRMGGKNARYLPVSSL